MRALQTKDLGLFSKIVSKMGIKEEIKGLFVDITDKTDKELEQLNQKLGVQLMLVVVENYWKAEKEVFTLLANLTGDKKEDIEKLPLSDFVELLKELSKDKSLADFFSLVVK